MDVWIIIGAVGAVVAAGAAVAGMIYARRSLRADPRLSVSVEGEHIVMAVRNHGYRPVYLEGILVTLDEGMTTRWIGGAYGPRELGGRRQAIFTTTPSDFVQNLPDFEPRRFCVRTSDGDIWWPVPPPVVAAIAQANAQWVQIAD
jgi:hypothetical protein